MGTSSNAIAPHRCRACGYRSEHAGFFLREKGWPLGLKQLVCPACKPGRPMRNEVRTYAAILICFALGLLLQALPGRHFASQAVLFIFGFLTLTRPLTTLTHEVGHALAAWSVGAAVPVLELGDGRTLARFRLGQTEVRLKRFVFGGGQITRRFPDGEAPRWKKAVVLVGGAGLNLVVAALLFRVWWLAHRTPGGPLIVSHPILNGLLTGAALSQAFAVLNLWPRMAVRAGLPVATDGRQLLNLLRADPSEAWATPFADGVTALKEKDIGRAAERFTESWALDPKQGGVLGSLIYAIGERDGPAAGLACHAENAERIAALPESDTLGRAVLDNNVAWYQQKIGDPTLLAEADERSLRALETLPDFANFNGTRGAVLAAVGRPDEAIPLLLKAARTSEAPETRAEACASLADCYAAQGKASLAAEFGRLGEWLGAKAG